MTNQVYANNMEVSCKAANGKSVAAFPDVCFTPPQTPATPPGVPIPYPNTGLASDTTNGSRSVKISKKEVMLKNKSYFKKSYGDEAGCAPKKGIITSRNMGKVYFNAWSMNVRIEGENAVRMMDITTHNHGSFPGNSPTWPYIDEMAFALDATSPCKDLSSSLKANCASCVQKTKTKDATVKRKASVEAMCSNDLCKEAMKCVLSPYAPSNCCTNTDGKAKTPHHIIPAHCFMPPGTRGANGQARYDGCHGYSISDAPCICVDGEGKEKEHGKIHKIIDAAEDAHLIEGKAGFWTYEEASQAGSAAVAQITGCSKSCLKSQVDAYHQQENKSPNISSSTKLRADSSGNRKLSEFVPSTQAAVDSF